jgi:hypothetical protein
MFHCFVYCRSELAILEVSFQSALFCGLLVFHFIAVNTIVMSITRGNTNIGDVYHLHQQTLLYE